MVVPLADQSEGVVACNRKTDWSLELRSSAGLTLKWKTASSYLDISLAAPVEYLESDDKKTFSISFGSEF